MKSLKRPRGLIAVITVQVLAGLLSLIGGIIPSAFSLTAQAPSLGFLQFLAPVLPIVLIVLGIFYLSLSYGLWKGYGWAWAAEIVFILVHIVADIGFLASRSFAIDKFVGLVVIGLILWYLLRPGVRAYFGKGKKPILET
jgi:multisubunit Na+/H+ antiporter MnhB subunit